MPLNKRLSQLRWNCCGVTSKYCVEFRAWYNEWEGSTFPGTPGVNGTGSYGDYGPQTKYNGHGATYGAQGDLARVEKLYKLKPPLIIKRMKKKL